MSKGLPKWIAEEVQNAQWEIANTFKGTGYFLELNPRENNADIQFYDPLPGSRYIVTADIPGSIKVDTLKKGEIYSFEIKIFKAVLSDKAKNFLNEQYQINMDAIYRYELMSAELFAED